MIEKNAYITIDGQDFSDPNAINLDNERIGQDLSESSHEALRSLKMSLLNIYVSGDDNYAQLNVDFDIAGGIIHIVTNDDVDFDQVTYEHEINLVELLGPDQVNAMITAHDDSARSMVERHTEIKALMDDKSDPGRTERMVELYDEARPERDAWLEMRNDAADMLDQALREQGLALGLNAKHNIVNVFFESHLLQKFGAFHLAHANPAADAGSEALTND